ALLQRMPYLSAPRRLLRPSPLPHPADVGDAAAHALPHVDALDERLRRIDIDLQAALGRLLDLLHPRIERMRGPPAGRRVLVGEGELELLGARERGEPEPGRGHDGAASAYSGEVGTGSPIRICAKQRILSTFRFRRNGTRSSEFSKGEQTWVHRAPPPHPMALTRASKGARSATCQHLGGLCATKQVGACPNYRRNSCSPRIASIRFNPSPSRAIP